jgi:hypothetical protein
MEDKMTEQTDEGKLVAVFDCGVRAVDRDAGLVDCVVLDTGRPEDKERSTCRCYEMKFEIRPNDALIEAGDVVRYSLYRKDRKLHLKMEKLPQIVNNHPKATAKSFEVDYR